MISKNIDVLINLSKDLNTIIEKLRLESDGLIEQIQKSRDIETYSHDDQLNNSLENKVSFEEEFLNAQRKENDEN